MTLVHWPQDQGLFTKSLRPPGHLFPCARREILHAVLDLVHCSATAVLAVMCLGISYASGPIGVYALVEKVTFEPAADKPDRIRISGVFLTAEDGSSNIYSAPLRCYLYFSLPRGNEQLARR